MSVLAKYKVHILLFILIFSIFLKLTYAQATSTHGFPSDMQEHIQAIDLFFYSDLKIAHPLWHINVKLVSSLFMISLESSAALITTLSISIWVLIVYVLVQRYAGLNVWKSICTTFIISMIGPLYIPGLAYYVVHGQGSPNIWHNNTLALLKPIAFIVFIYTLKVLHTPSFKNALISILFLVLSLLAKPSFAIAFLPALLGFVYIKKYISSQNQVFILTITVLAIVVVSFQMYYAFDVENSVKIAFLESWKLKSMNVPVSIFMSLAFPFVLLGLHAEVLRDEKILMSWLMIAVSLIYATVLIEDGPRARHGNFMWSYMISLSFVYTFSIIRYFLNYRAVDIWKKIILNGLLIYQVSVGAYYFFMIYLGYNPIYISI